MVNQPEGPTLRNCLKQKKNNYQKNNKLVKIQ